MDEKNYITRDGFTRLQEEYRKLRLEERPEIVETVAWAASNGDRSENGDYIYGKKKMREIDRRLRFLSKQLNNAEIVDPEKTKSDKVLFGATVRIEDEDGVEKTYIIVGTDEFDASKNRVSWKSPIARSLMNKKVGDLAIVKLPAGEKELEIIKICYQKLD